MANTIAVEPPAALAFVNALRNARNARGLGALALPVDRCSPGFASTLRDWQRLTRNGPPFLTPEFLMLTAELAQAEEPLLFAARCADGLVAALPLVRHGRTLEALRSDHSPRVDLAGHAHGLPAVWRAIRDDREWDLLELSGVPADSPLATALPDLARQDGCDVYVRETHRAPWLMTDGIEQRIHRRFRGDMRRLERQLGGVELERFTRVDRGVLGEALRLEAAAWKGDAGTAIACDARLVHFYAALTRVFARRGRLSLSFLRAQGKRIAAQIALEDESTYYLFKVGYDPEYAHFGPGQLLVRETAADAARRGLTRYDLQGRDTPWKLKWTDQARAHVEVLVYAPSARGRLRHFVREVARPLAGRTLRTLTRRASAPPAPARS